MKKIILSYYVIPLIIFLSLLLLFWRGLQLDPHQVPSNLLNKTLPKLDLPDLINSQHRLTNQDFIGHVSLLNIWASWCVNCRLEHPFLMDLAQTQQIKIFSIDYKDDSMPSQQFLKQFGNPYQIVGFDKIGNTSINLGVYGTPESFLIDKNGIIRYKIIGPITQKIWQEQIQPLIKKLQS